MTMFLISYIRGVEMVNMSEREQHKRDESQLKVTHVSSIIDEEPLTKHMHVSFTMFIYEMVNDQL